MEPTFDLETYLSRIGYAGPREPTAATLAALHVAHVEAIPFENLDIALGLPIKLDLASLATKMVVAKRGGYCFEHNSLFAEVLRALGFAVEILGARVRMGPPRPTARTHCLLRVTIDGAPWLADVGFGADGLYEPLPWREGEDLVSGGIRYRLEPEGKDTVLHATLPNTGWLPLYAINPADPMLPIDLEVGNWYTSTHPASTFTRGVIAQRVGRDERAKLVNKELTIRRGSQLEKLEVGDPDQLLEVLRERFTLAFPAGTRFKGPFA